MKTVKPSTGHLQHVFISAGKWLLDIVKDYAVNLTVHPDVMYLALRSDGLGLRVPSCLMLLGGSPFLPSLKEGMGIVVQIKCMYLEYGRHLCS